MALAQLLLIVGVVAAALAALVRIVEAVRAAGQPPRLPTLDQPGPRRREVREAPVAHAVSAWAKTSAPPPIAKWAPPAALLAKDLPEGPADRIELGKSFRHGALVANAVTRDSTNQSYGAGESTSRRSADLLIRPRSGKSGWVRLSLVSWYEASDRFDSSGSGASYELESGGTGELASVYDYEKYNHAMDHDRDGDATPVASYLRETMGWEDVAPEAIHAFVRAAIRAL